jgi:predicted methyltransferase
MIFGKRISVFTAAILMGAYMLAPAVAGAGETAAAKLAAIVKGKHRTEQQIARNVYRHPVETLTFFGISDDMTVVEIWPFGGWYTSILAPFLRDKGLLYVAANDPNSTNKRELGYNAALKKMFDAHPEVYDKVITTALVPGKADIAPPGTADMVLTFRNIHNWQWAGVGKKVFEDAYRALKPGGILGVVEHRANPGMPLPEKPGNAYVGEDYAIALIESAGFKLLGKSEINANPRDTKDYPRGVWTLPPNYAMGDKDRDKYTAIGESDRFTMKFMKPVE